MTTSVKKCYVIDTNVLVHDACSFKTLLNDNNTILIPFIVLEELDKLKVKLDDVGVNARKAIREIESELVAKNERVILASYSVNVKSLDFTKPDNQILGVCLKHIDKKPILVSKDVCLRTKARAIDIPVQDYQKDRVESASLFTGIQYVQSTCDVISKVWEDGSVFADEEYNENESVILVDSMNPKNKALTIHKAGKLIKLDNNVKTFGLGAANLEQQIAINHLLDPDIHLVSLLGRSGSGKTLLAIAAALEMVLERGVYNKTTVARPIMAFQKDIGFLPGDMNEKLGPWLLPISDNLDFLFSFADQPKNKKVARVSAFEELQEQGVLEVSALTHMRGRSIPKQFIIVDECQNLSPFEIKTILTRAGQDTKIVLTGDIEQIDSPYLSADTNGLIYAVEKFKNEKLAAHVTFTKCERSPLADIAAKIL